MPDREKIESLKQCLSASCRGFRTCPYNDTEWDAIKTVLELLAEQEPVEPFHVCIYGKELRTLITNRYFIFCPYCGRRIKWDA